MLHQAKDQVERGLRRTNAEICRPFHQAQNPPPGSNEATSLYRSLPKGYIRLLTTQLGDGDTTIYRLETYPQRIAPRYDAVSYCWGDDRTPGIIQVNGCVLQIRKGLLAFLKASLDRRPPLRPLWIDAICLNQDDGAEKADQIPSMGQIYKNASRTIVWLGEPEENTFQTLIFMKTVIKFAEEHDDITYISREHFPQEWEAVRRYMRRAWFNRLWVIQEAVLSKNIEILCHAQRINVIPWEELLRFEDILKKRNGYSNLIRDNSDDNSVFFGSAPFSSAPHFIELLRDDYRQCGRLYVWHFNEFHGVRQCTEPVDRVWASLGLLSPKFVALVNEAEIIDYSDVGRREFWKSYLAFMKILHSFEVKDFLIVIFSNISRKGTTPLPSWCVDFNEPLKYQPFQFRRHFRAGFVGPQDRTAVESALQPANDALSISGFSLDDVSLTASIYTRSTLSPGDEGDELVRWLQDCFAICSQTLGGSRATKIAMCHTMLATDKEQERLDFAKNAAKEERKTVDTILIEAHFSMIEAMKARGDEVQPIVALEYFRQIFVTCDNRRLFATKQGRIGLGPPDLQVGDKICAFIGAETLFALRTADHGSWITMNRTSSPLAPPPPPSPETFRLIGDAYVHGLMYGEAFTTKGRGPKQSFVLV